MAVAVTYNGFNLPNVFGAFSFSNNYTNIEFSCNFLVEAASESALVTACDSAESSLREPLDVLTVSFGGTSEYTYSHAANSVLNPSVLVKILESGPHGGICRAYKFSFRGDLPADKSGFDFRRYGASNFTVDFAATNRRTVTFNLEYTASESPSQTSLQNFDSFAQTHVETILTDLIVTGKQ